MARKAREKRPYQQGARAESAAATADRILGATTALVMERWLDEITLDLIAERAEVNVRTVIRRFATRDDVVQAAVDRFRTRLEGTVLPKPTPGDAHAAVRLLVEYYERDAAFLLRGLAQEARFPFLQVNFAGTRSRHRAWVADAFSPQLAAIAAKERTLVLTELAAVTWVSTWKFLRLDSGASRADTEVALERMVRAIAHGGSPSP